MLRTKHLPERLVAYQSDAFYKAASFGGETCSRVLGTSIVPNYEVTFLRDAEKVRMKVEPINAAAMKKLVARLSSMPAAAIKSATKLLKSRKKKKK